MRVFRAAALILFCVTAVHAARLAAQQANDTSAGPPPITDPLAKELERCKALHEQAANDERCKAASKEATKRFFQPPSDYQPGKVDMFPKSQKQPWATDTKPSSPQTDK
jgi:conjugative transfer region protein TrbK